MNNTELEKDDVLISDYFPVELKPSYLKIGTTIKKRKHCEICLSKLDTQVSDMKISHFASFTICNKCLRELSKKIDEHIETKDVQSNDKNKTVVSISSKGFKVTWNRNFEGTVKPFKIEVKTIDEVKLFVNDLNSLDGVDDIAVYAIDTIIYRYNNKSEILEESENR